MSHNLTPQLVRQVEEAAEIVKQGGIVAFPTDTVYGLGAGVFNNEAVDRIYKVKQRPHHLPLPILLADCAQLAIVTASVSEIAWLLIKYFWPGGLTLVLPKATSFHSNATAGSDKVAIRIPNHVVPIALIRNSGVPIVGTSANLSSEPSALTPEGVRAQLGDNVDLIVDGGKCHGGLESTIVDLTGKVPVILRQGIVPEEEIKKIYREYAKEADDDASCLGQ